MITLVIVLCMGLLYAHVSGISLVKWPLLLLAIAVFTALRVSASKRLWGGALSMSPAAAFAILFSNGAGHPPAIESAMLVALVGTIAGEAIANTRRWRRGIFEGCALALAVNLGAQAYSLVYPQSISLAGGPAFLLGLAAAGVVVFLVDTSLVALEAMMQGADLHDLERSLLRGRGSAYVACLPLVCAALYFWPREGFMAVVVLAIPALVAGRAVRKTYEILLVQRQLAAMERINRHAVGDRDIHTLITQFVKAMQYVAPLDEYALWLTEEENANLRLADASEQLKATLPETIEPGTGFGGWAAERRRMLLVRDARSDARFPSLTLRGSIVAVPLLVQKKLVGVFEMRSWLPGGFNGAHTDSAETLCREIAVAIENHRLHQKLRELAVTDGLTGLLNHRRMYETLRDEIWRAQRYGHSVSVVMIDVDSFKNYNDAYGHPKGDVLLRSIGDIISETIRSVDIAARYGGEEYLVIMPETGKQAAMEAAERIRKAVENAVFEGRSDTHHVRKTVSLGLATYPEDTRNYAELITLADRALYKAKQRGKNRVLTA